MADERIFVAKKLARDLWNVENAIDQALAGAAGLAAALPQARQQVKVSAVVVQAAFDKAAAAVAALTEARRQIVELHGALDEVRESIGMRPLAVGGGFVKPSVALTANGPVAQAA